MLAGCLAAAALAIVTDALLGSIERSVGQRRPRLALAAGVAFALGVGAAILPLLHAGRATVTVGAKNFSEQYILARLIGSRLERAGYRVRYREGLGSAVAFQALAHGDVDVYVDYAGTLWTGAMGRRDTLSRPATLDGIARWMAAGPGTRVVGPLGFENAYAIAMRADAGLRTLDQLAARAPTLTLGADLEFLDRPEWRAVRDAYRLRFAATRAYSPTFMYRALASRQVDAISAFSSDGRIAADHLTVLSDPKGALPHYDALLLVAPAHARDARFGRCPHAAGRADLGRRDAPGQLPRRSRPGQAHAGRSGDLARAADRPSRLTPRLSPPKRRHSSRPARAAPRTGPTCRRGPRPC